MNPTVKASGPTQAKILIVGEAPGYDDLLRNEPFCGASGAELTKMLHEAGIIRSDCRITFFIPRRLLDRSTLFPEAKKDVTSQHIYINGRPVAPEVQGFLEALEQEVHSCQPNIIIPLGELALWACTGHRGITTWRGSELACFGTYKCIPTLAPDVVLRQWDWRALVVNDLRRAFRESAYPELITPEYSFLIRPSFQAVMDQLQALEDLLAQRKVLLSVDIETRHTHTACIGIAWSKTAALCIPLMCVEADDGYWSAEEETIILQQVGRLLTHPNVEVIGQNFSYDAQYIIRYWGFAPLLHHDTMLKQHVLFAGMSKSLDFLSSLYCEHHTYWKDDGRDWNPKVPEEQLWTYNCMDCVRTFEINEVLTQALQDSGLQEVYDFQIRLWYAVLAMMLRGVSIDHSNRAAFAQELFDAIHQREVAIVEMLGHPINVRSPKQMQSLFYEDLKLPVQINRKTKTPTLDDKAMTKLVEKEPLIKPLVSLIQDIRSLGVFLSTFVQAPLDTDKRMRCNFNLAGTETYRFNSSANPFNSGTNLQNIPKGNEEPRPGELSLPNVRRLFIPDQYHTIFDIDLDRADLQVVTWEADDTDMKQMLREGVDMHSENAKVLGCSRRMAKAFCHGTNYGGGARTMAMNCGLTTHQADVMQRKWFAAHPGIKDWHRRTEAALMHKREVRNAFGYRRFFFDRVEGLLPEALAWIPQSTVACVINRALLNIAVNVPKVELSIQVHDSLVGQIRTVYLQQELPHIHSNMLITIPYPDPLIIPCGIKTSSVSWGEVEELKWPD